MTLRRKLRFALLVVFAALAGWAGLTWHWQRQAAGAADALRQLRAEVRETHSVPGWWRRVAKTTGIPAERGPFITTSLEVTLARRSATPDALKIAARHPGLTKLTILDAPGICDDAFAALQGCDKVTDLNLLRVGIGDAGIRHVANWHKLRLVSVQGCQVTDEGVRLLCGLPSVDIVTCGGPGIKAFTAHDLKLTGPDGVAATPGEPAAVKGRLVAMTPLPAGVTAEIRARAGPNTFEDSGAYFARSGDAAPDGSYGFEVPIGNVLRAGQNRVFVTVWLPGKPTLRYTFPPVTFDVPER